MPANTDTDTTCWVLLLLFLVLILLLVYLYRRLNRDTGGQYTVHKFVLDEGGLRDRVRSGVTVVETRLGLHLWPRPRPSSDNEYVIGDGQPPKDGDVETGQEPSDNCGVGAHGEDKRPDDSEDDYSSMDLQEHAKLIKDSEEKDSRKEREREEEELEKENEEDERMDRKNTESLGLLVNLQQLSGSAIWSGEKKKENEGIDLTAL